MSEVWRIDIENHSGEIVTSLKNFQYLGIEKRIARRSSFRIQLADNDPNRDLIGKDYIARVWYKNTTFDVPWTNIFNGIIKTPSRVWYSNGRQLAIFYGSGSNELISKSLVMYPSDTSQADKSGIASDVMAEYLEENIGSLALISNGRFFDHVNPVTINSDGSGPVWSGNMGHDQLVKALQDIRDYSRQQGDRVDFQAVYTGNYQWRIDIGKIYNDRTINGLNINTGLNGAGNAPIILSPNYNNLDEYVETESRIAEANAILALGRYTGSARESATLKDDDSIGVSPIAQREYLLQAQNTEDLLETTRVALADSVGKVTASITPKFSPAFALFRDIDVGDFFTVVTFGGEAINKQFTELKIVVQQTTGGSTISQYTMFVEDGEP